MDSPASPTDPTRPPEGHGHEPVVVPPQRKLAKIPLLILGVIVILVLVAAISIAVTRGEPTLLEESTPAGVVQRYVAAAVDGDEATAAGYLTEAVFADCSPMEQFRADNLSITLISTKERSNSADVAVSIASFSGNGPFGAQESSYEDVFSLVRTDGAWRISSAPWDLTICPNEGTK
ncbi:hypothetical protein [Arthrobacter sp.]|uniref:hypothetical protein n=1 Tax=Arthrobacter sp. TaxID=1667 RepID=UPI0026E105A7|nr:hypothetical protein [Arthrobacter sp.]MDO5752894.1 hypothetical protein [Arthrobacter sp.]